MIPRPPGTEDIFPDNIERWNRIINTARDVFKIYNFREIIVPIMEYTEVFSRGLGEATDIVSKEMFTFEDRGGRSLTLRPEGTASVVRAYSENGDYNRLSSVKFFYTGPMFRAERPQKGRLRQFNQLGAEIFGSGDAYHDYEIISMINAIARRCNIKSYSILLNSIGCEKCRDVYLKDLKEYYIAREQRLCKDCQTRLHKNTLRLLDCKNDSCREIKNGAPLITNYLDNECAAHYEALKSYLKSASIEFKETPYLVRGLDYYTRTTFEFVSDSLGAQNAFAAGGRYDNLVEQFHGKSVPAIGFAAGIERMLLLSADEDGIAELDAFIIHTGGATLEKAVSIAKDLRELGVSVDLDPVSKGFKSQFKRAERENARYCVIIGEDELANNSAGLKNQKTGEQTNVPFEQLANRLV